MVLDVGLEVEQDPRGLGGPLPPHVPRQDACTCGPKWPMRWIDIYAKPGRPTT